GSHGLEESPARHPGERRSRRCCADPELAEQRDELCRRYGSRLAVDDELSEEGEHEGLGATAHRIAPLLARVPRPPRHAREYGTDLRGHRLVTNHRRSLTCVTFSCTMTEQVSCIVAVTPRHAESRRSSSTKN